MAIACGTRHQIPAQAHAPAFLFGLSLLHACRGVVLLLRCVRLHGGLMAEGEGRRKEVVRMAGEDLKWLSVPEYAEMMGKDPQHIRDLCLQGEIEARKIGRCWAIPYMEPESVRAEQRVQEAVNGIVGACVAFIDASIVQLTEVRETLKEVAR